MGNFQDFDARPIIGGLREAGSGSQTVTNPYTGETVVVIQTADAEAAHRAVALARSAQPEVASMPMHARADLLRRVAEIVGDRAEDFARNITTQTGKALKDTRREITRSRLTLRAAAAACESDAGEVLAADAIPGGEGLIAMVRREPLGVIAAISPFNAPFNLAMHKVAAAVAAGNAVVLKPSSHAPLTGLDLADCFLEAGLPAGAISVLPGAGVGKILVEHPDIDAVSFTGSVSVGEEIARGAGLKRLVLELGGNSPNVVHEDADVDWSVRALVPGAFSNTGQSCNSVQRILVHEAVANEFEEALIGATGRLVVGDPIDPATDVGTLVDEHAARRVEAWVDEAVEHGARVAVGGSRAGAAYAPTVLLNARPDMRVCVEEVFGPVVSVMRYSTLDEAIHLANATRYGLQAGVFTRSLKVAFEVSGRIRAGGVMINRSSNTRLDHAPFGGRGSSGLGREGGRFSFEELTVLKLTIIDPAGVGSPHPLAAAR